MRWSLFACALMACGRNEGAPDSPQQPIDPSEVRSAGLSTGELSYRRYCIGCHGDDGKGNAGTTGADLTAADGPLRTKQDAELFLSVRNGKTGKLASMPAHSPVLKDDQIREVLAYVRQRFAP